MILLVLDLLISLALELEGYKLVFDLLFLNPVLWGHSLPNSVASFSLAIPPMVHMVKLKTNCCWDKCI